MVLAMGWGLLMLILVLIVSNVVINQIRPSDRSEKSFAALSAAEAGLADLDARLQVGTITSVTGDATNLALRGWVPVPGGNTDSEFTYAIDATKSGAVGEVRAYSTGRSGGITRTVEAVLSKRSTLDYVYMSDIESPSPDTPGVYGTSQYSSSGYTYQEAARLLCARRWAEPGPVSVNRYGSIGQGNQRNLRFCRWAGIFSSEQLIGRIHTNDVWWLQNADLSSVLDANSVTSSCRSAVEGLEPSEVGCPADHRYVTASYNSAGYSSTPDSYQGDYWRPSGTDITKRNPGYDTILDLPENPSLLKQRAAESGCIYTGPTRIRFFEEGGAGYMAVTSPDTKMTNPGCDGHGGDGTLLQSSPTNQYTATVHLDDFSDLVIYVQDVRPDSDVDIPGVDYTDPSQRYYWEKQNQWASGTEPTCIAKGGEKYPYVIPNDPVDAANFSSGSTYRGFPSELADPYSPWYGATCASGDLYVQGEYRGAVMLTTENNVILTSSLRDSQLENPTASAGAADYGKPLPSSTSTAGIAAGRFAYLYRPITSDGTWVRDWRVSNANDPVYNVALLAIQHCFATQDYNKSYDNGDIHLWGSIAQKFRCAVGISGGSGYGKQYKYDDRLTQRTPPYMLELSDEPWGDQRTGEISPVVQPVAEAIRHSLLGPGEEQLSVRNIRLAAAPDVALTTLTPLELSGEVEVSSPLPGLVVIVYEVGTPGDWEIRRLVLLVE